MWKILGGQHSKEHEISAQREKENKTLEWNRTGHTYEHSVSCMLLSSLFTLSLDTILTLRRTQKCAHAYQPPTCIHHLAILRLRCLWGKVSCKGDSVCVCMRYLCMCECVSERERERNRDIVEPVIISSKRENRNYTVSRKKDLHRTQIVATLPALQVQYDHIKGSTTHLQHCRYMCCRKGFHYRVRHT